ncbi:MAG TPA: Pr6Pr family membrane protein [Ktedonobacteraceae bacterium]|nr:Pr6Pr family membrane protein [Ktedonobacteraceae bacterium]
MKLNTGLIQFRLGWALLGIAGLVLQGIATEMTRPGYFTDLTRFVNFFSYFTILTNLFITIWFILAFRSRQTGQARWWGDQPEIKGALLVAGTVTILVYWTLLVDIPIPNVTGEIANFLLHLLVPLGLLIDWLIIGRDHYFTLGATVAPLASPATARLSCRYAASPR